MCQDISGDLKEFKLNNLLVLPREGKSAGSKNISTMIGFENEILTLKIILLVIPGSEDSWFSYEQTSITCLYTLKYNIMYLKTVFYN